MDSSKHSWSGILVQYLEQTKDDDTTIKNYLSITYPITYQSKTFQVSQRTGAL